MEAVHFNMTALNITVETAMHNLGRMKFDVAVLKKVKDFIMTTDRTILVKALEKGYKENQQACDPRYRSCARRAFVHRKMFS